MTRTGRPESIYLVEISDDTGIATNTFLIPLPSHVAVAPFGAANEPPVNIPAVSAEPVDDQQDEDSTTSENTGS